MVGGGSIVGCMGFFVLAEALFESTDRVPEAELVLRVWSDHAHSGDFRPVLV